MFIIKILKWNNIKDVLLAVMNSTMILVLAMLLFPFLGLLAPVPLTLLFLRRSYQETILALLIEFLLLSALLGSQLAVINMTFVAILVLATGFFLLEHFDNRSIVIWSALGCILFSVTIYFSIKFNYGLDLLVVMKESMTELLRKNPMESVGGMDVNQLIRASVEYIIQILPALLTLTFVLAAYLNLLLSLHRLKGLGRIDANLAGLVETWGPREIPYLPKIHFSYWWLLLAGGSVGSLYLIDYLLGWSNQLVFSNLLFFFTGIFTFNGLAIGDYFLRKKRMFLRILLPVLVNLLGLSIVYMLLGTLDAIVNFRKRGWVASAKI